MSSVVLVRQRLHVSLIQSNSGPVGGSEVLDVLRQVRYQLKILSFPRISCENVDRKIALVFFNRMI